MKICKICGVKLKKADTYVSPLTNYIYCKKCRNKIVKDDKDLRKLINKE